MNLDKQSAETLVRTGILAPGDAVLVGVSGGPDSVALLHFLHEIAASLRLRLEVAHAEHGIRGDESRDDAEFVRGIASRLSLPFHLTRLELARPGRDRRSGNVEALARERRYRFFAEVAAQRKITRVAVGHNRDDQLETMFMWLLRGCGPEGLQGMPAVRPLARDVAGAEEAVLIRPLLDVSRRDILAFLERRGLEHREDRTNRETRYLRNWIRLDLLPGLRDRSDGGLDERLGRLGGMLRSDNALLERWVAEVYPRVAHGDELDRAAFLGLEPGLQARMLRFWLGRGLGTLRRIGFVHVDAVLKVIEAAVPHGSVSLPGSWIVVREYDSVRLVRSAAASRADDYCYALPLEGEVEIPEAGVRVTAWRSDSRERPEGGFEAAFDLTRLERDGGELRMRNFRPGDRLRPLGMTGHKKLKDLFIDLKVPRSRRRTLPLLLAGEEILWVPGCARSDFATVGPDTGAVWRVRISWRPPMPARWRDGSPSVDLGRSGSY